jgi:death-on-curing family protein
MSVRDEGTIEWAASGIRKAGEEGEPIWDVAGLALYRIVREHPFMDCNHRTGWLLCRTLMHIFGYELAVSGEEVVAFVKSIDADRLEEAQVKEWVRQSFFRLS